MVLCGPGAADAVPAGFQDGPQTLRLSDEAVAVLTALPRLACNPHMLHGRCEGGHIINLQKPWRRIRGLAGLEDVRLHDLRHSFASVAAANGASHPYALT